jgi:DNA polymerase-3 subunit epsilon/CBS domain-containing protein
VAGRSATQLISLDAVVIDTETTGLDPRNARIVELAAVRLAGGRLDEGRHLRRLVRPGQSIPAAATRIHGIDDAAVAAAPDFGAVWPEYSGFLGGAVVIGHSVGFDLTVIGRECERAGVKWHVPPTLDTGLLAQFAAPALAEYSLEGLAAWLGVELAARHSALGDAITTGRIFHALVPRLRERGVRTLAEAMRASDTLHGSLEDRQRAGWEEAVPVWRRAAPERERAHADTDPYRKQVGTIMTSPARSVSADTRLGAALSLMAGERISSLFVAPPGGAPAFPADTGIITERDVLRTLGMRGATAFDCAVGEVMSRPLATVPGEALAYVAIGRMNRLGIRHLGVTDEAGRVVGALSARDLLRLRAEGAIELGDELATAKDVHDLGQSWSRLTHVVANLIEDGLTAREIAAVISQNVVEMTRRAAELAEAAMADGGHGSPPCRYALVVLGSAGRGESLLAMDQDNALVFADDAPAGADRWFEQFAGRVNDILHEAGIPYCKGGVMARNAPWRGAQAAWRERIDRWVLRSSAEDLLSVDIFFDLRVAHGDAGMADRLWRHAFYVVRDKPEFAKLLVAAVGSMPAGRNWFGGFRTEQGRIDLKRAGLFGIVSVARALAVCHHVVEHSTPARLSGLMALKLGLESDLDALIDAQSVLLDLILDQQVDDIKHGRPAANTVEVKRLSRRDRARLRTALQAVENLDEIARSLLFRN